MADNNQNTWNITATNSGDVDQVDTFANIQNIIGGTADDNFLISDGAGISGTIDGNAGNDTLNYSAYTTPVTLKLSAVVNIENAVGSQTSRGTIVGDNTNNSWNLTGLNAGSVDTLNFVDFDNLTGGDANDTFTINDSGKISGNIDGGKGIDTLNYSQFSTPVIVNLGDASADTPPISVPTTGTPTAVPPVAPIPTAGTTGVGGTLRNIDNVVGNDSGTNTLIANNKTPNDWNITRADGGDVNGVAFSSFENLKGGDLDDTFKFEEGGSVTGVIDGSLGFDVLDYSSYFSVPVKVDIAAGTATSTGGIVNIEDYIQPSPLSPPQQETEPGPQEEETNVTSSSVIACTFSDDQAFSTVVVDRLLPTIAAYMNTYGGSLSTPVTKLLAGCGEDLIALPGNQTLLKEHIMTLVSEAFGPEYTKLVTVNFENLPAGMLLVVEVAKSPIPAYIKEQLGQAFYIWQEEGTQNLDSKSSQMYIQKHWK